MLDKKAYHKKIHDLVPCLEHGHQLVGYINYFQTEMEKESDQHNNIELLYRWKSDLTESLGESKNPNLTDIQLSDFNDIQGKVLELLSKEK